MMNEFKHGDRVRLVKMDDDPDPIPVGTEGTVTFCNPVQMGRDSFTQVSVNWDNGRSLMVVCPPDIIRRI